MTECNICPRKCNVDRDKATGYCGMPDNIYVARASLHEWEEPCISGENGSGTVFFTGCPLRCVYCQNYNIAAGRVGKKVSVDELAQIFINLQEKNAENINLVTPTHYTEGIVQALRLAKRNGLTIPVVYNTSGYERTETLKKLEGLVDVYLPDMKYVSTVLSAKYSAAPDYFKVASEALKEMVRQTGKARFDERRMLKSGVVVRHLVLPGCVDDSKAVVKYLYDTYGDDIYISIMNQYTPLEHVKDYPEINRKVTEDEYEQVVEYAIDAGVVNGFIQEGDTAQESFIPDFETGEGI